MVFDDGAVFAPQSVDPDVGPFVRPSWRFKRFKAVSPLSAEGKTLVDTAFVSLLDLLAADPIAAREWSESSFHPPGSPTNRTIGVHLRESALTFSFVSKMPKYFLAIASNGKHS